jgi:ATP-dependent helicase/nuclease subunit B
MSDLPLGLPEPLFGGSAPRLRAAPASAAFLEVLANAMASELTKKNDPFALSDALVLLPNRRGARGLMDAFAKRLGGAALLPTIRPLGDPHADDDPGVWGADLIGDEIAPPIDKMQRRLQLASFIRRRDKAENGIEDPARALALADELGKLLDSAATVERVEWSKLRTLVEEIDLARHWASSAAFLDIIATYWPEILKEQGVSDPATHGAAIRLALAARWKADPPKRPIVIAGSTGSQHTTRELMRVVASLPRGVVVLPGVDIDLDDSAWDLIGDQHPQHALKDTLKALGADRRAIPLMEIEKSSGRARRVLMREALAPAEKTADWLERLELAGGKAFVAEGANGLKLLEAATEDEEAMAIALMLREVLETPNASAAVVTPDAGLARRIEAKLSRWGIAPAVSHGMPLRETDSGRLMALLCELAHDEGDPVALAAFLKHPRVILARDAYGLTRLEHKILRGPRRYDTLQDLIAVGERGERGKPIPGWPQASAIVEATRVALAPLTALMSQKQVSLARFAEALSAAAEEATQHECWQGRDGEAAASLLREAITHGEALGLMHVRAAPRVLMKLLGEGSVAPPSQAGDTRIAIWGLLEARLQRRELMILAGLNEGTWPAPPSEDPFLSRGMRARLGLPSVDERIGLAAHDFAQLANAPSVVMTRALRKDGSPTVASRWLWRLQTLIKGAKAELASAQCYIDWAQALDHPPAIRAASPPKPKPPAHQRLKKISVTTVETLIRDPYAVYARRILGLENLKPIGAPAGPSERGTAVHAAIEDFGDGDDPKRLSDLLDEKLRHAGVSPERRAAERERLNVSINALIAWFNERRGRAAEVHREKRGELVIGDIVLSGVADRIEIAPDYAAILDFKTGAPPSDKQVESGLSPQLLLEAAMLEEGAFAGVPKREVGELIYWRFGGADPTPRSVELATGIPVAAREALAELRKLLAQYAEPERAFLSKPRVFKIKLYDDYDHLARRKEWADERADE